MVCHMLFAEMNYCKSDFTEGIVRPKIFDMLVIWCFGVASTSDGVLYMV